MSMQAHGVLVPVGGGDPIPLIRDKLTIGRREICDIHLPFPNVSGLHAELSYRNGYWHIRDKGSTNGIKVNGTRVQEKYLHPNDEITIAKRKFKISYELQAGHQALEDIMEDEDVLGVPLMEKAGLTRPKREREERHINFDPGEYLLDDDEEER
jgi:pSer/pThr/pTyr-binding forkhead associated (FHA) protein